MCRRLCGTGGPDVSTGGPGVGPRLPQIRGCKHHITGHRIAQPELKYGGAGTESCRSGAGALQAANGGGRTHEPFGRQSAEVGDARRKGGRRCGGVEGRSEGHPLSTAEPVFWQSDATGVALGWGGMHLNRDTIAIPGGRGTMSRADPLTDQTCACGSLPSQWP